jgi:hypothetical protein
MPELQVDSDGNVNDYKLQWVTGLNLYKKIPDAELSILPEHKQRSLLMQGACNEPAWMYFPLLKELLQSKRSILSTVP